MTWRPANEENAERPVGRVGRGLEILPKIKQGDTMLVKILRLGAEAKAFVADEGHLGCPHRWPRRHGQDLPRRPRRVCDRIIAFEGDGQVHINEGNYSYYLEKSALPQRRTHRRPPRRLCRRRHPGPRQRPRLPCPAQGKNPQVNLERRARTGDHGSHHPNCRRKSYRPRIPAQRRGFHLHSAHKVSETATAMEAQRQPSSSSTPAGNSSTPSKQPPETTTHTSKTHSTLAELQRIWILRSLDCIVSLADP